MNTSLEALDQLVRQFMPHTADVGMSVDRDSPRGKLRMRIPGQPMLAADPGEHFFFPGILFSLADTACGLAAVLKLNRKDEHSTTLDMRIDYFAPASFAHDLVAEAECYRITRTVAFARCELRSGTRLVAAATGTFMRSPARQAVSVDTSIGDDARL